jgi:hypothetical protein
MKFDPIFNLNSNVYKFVTYPLKIAKSCNSSHLLLNFVFSSGVESSTHDMYVRFYPSISQLLLKKCKKKKKLWVALWPFRVWLATPFGHGVPMSCGGGKPPPNRPFGATPWPYKVARPPPFGPWGWFDWVGRTNPMGRFTLHGLEIWFLLLFL